MAWWVSLTSRIPAHLLSRHRECRPQAWASVGNSASLGFNNILFRQRFLMLSFYLQ